MEQLRAGFKIIIKWNRNRWEMTNQTENNTLNYLTDTKFTKVNRLFVLSFENENDRTSFFKVLCTKCSNKRLVWHTYKKLRANIQTKYWNGKKQWIDDRQFIGLWVLFKTLQIICNRCKQTNSIRTPWLKTKN